MTTLKMPKVDRQILKNRDNLFEFAVDDFQLTEYSPHPFISAPIAV